jgi:hypothetical protein
MGAAYHTTVEGREPFDSRPSFRYPDGCQPELGSETVSDQTARDSASGAALANATLWGALLRAFVGRGILTDERVFSLLQEAELDLLSLHTMPGAIGAGQVQRIREDFQKAKQNPPVAQ